MELYFRSRYIIKISHFLNLIYKQNLGNKIIHSVWMRNDLAASVIGISFTIILQSNNAVVSILISMVAGNCESL